MRERKKKRGWRRIYKCKIKANEKNLFTNRLTVEKKLHTRTPKKMAKKTGGAKKTSTKKVAKKGGAKKGSKKAGGAKKSKKAAKKTAKK
jgi:hypothetical protein